MNFLGQRLSMSVSDHKMDWVRINRNLKKVRLTVLKSSLFSSKKCSREGHELVISRIQLFLFRDILELFWNKCDGIC